MTCARRCLYGPIDAPSVRTAWKGRLCETCYRRLRDHLLIAVPVYQLVREQVVPTLKAAEFGERVQSSRTAKLPFHEKPFEVADQVETVINGWGREVFRELPVKLDRDIPDVDTVEGSIGFMRDRFDEVVNLGFIADLHDELVSVIREAFSVSGMQRMPLTEAVGSMCPICLTRETQVDWVGEVPDLQMKVTCKKCRLVIFAGQEGESGGR